MVDDGKYLVHVSTHSRLKAAGIGYIKNQEATAVSTHSRLKAAGSHADADGIPRVWFQHTAA